MGKGEVLKRDYVQSLERGLAVMRYLSGTSDVTLADVARATNITRAAARRFLLTLEQLGYVGKQKDRYRLLARTLELSCGHSSPDSLPNLVQPHIEKLAADLNESCSVTVLDRHRHCIIYIARVSVSRLVGASLTVGSTLPAYCTSAGKVLLAGLPEDELEEFLKTADLKRRTSMTITSVKKLREEIRRVAEQGWSLTNQEIEEGVRSVAAPLIDGTGKVVAAVNVGAYATRVTIETMHRRYLRCVLDTANAINDVLQARK